VTVIVGIVCSDGAVLASDSAATFGTGVGERTIGQQPTKKIEVLEGAVLFATSGPVGLAQSIGEAVRTLYARKAFVGVDSIKAKDILSETIRGVLAPAFRATQEARQAGLPPAITEHAFIQTIVAIPVKSSPHLFSFSPQGLGEAATEGCPFVSIGSGQTIADPFLAHLRRLFWPARLPSVSEGTFAAVWTVQHVIRTNPGGVAGEVQVATLERGKGGGLGARLHAKEDIDEHYQSVAAAEEHLAAFPLTQTNAALADAELPKPPPPAEKRPE